MLWRAKVLPAQTSSFWLNALFNTYVIVTINALNSRFWICSRIFPNHIKITYRFTYLENCWWICPQWQSRFIHHVCVPAIEKNQKHFNGSRRVRRLLSLCFSPSHSNCAITAFTITRCVDSVSTFYMESCGNCRQVMLYEILLKSNRYLNHLPSAPSSE